MVLNDRAAEGEGVAPLNVRALEVLAPSAVAFSRSATPVNWCPVSLLLRFEGSGWGVGLLFAHRC